MSGRPDDGYRVRSRIEGRSSRRGRVVSVVVALLAGGWLLATITNRPSATAVATPDAPESSAPTEPSLDIGARPTLPPDIEAFAAAPTGAFPMKASDVRWLRPLDATWLESPIGQWIQFPFLLPGGALVCVCIEPGTGTADPNLLRLVVLGSDGREQEETLIERWSGEAAHEGFFADVGLTDDGLTAIVAVAAHDGDVWSVRLDRVDLSRNPPRLTASEEVAAFPVDALPGGALRGVVVRLSPDGAVAWVDAGSGLGTLFSPATPPVDSRIVSLAPGTFGKVIEVLDVDRGDRGTCIGGGWATPVDFVSICVDANAGTNGPQLAILLDSVDGSSDSVVLGNADQFDDASWLIDATAGLVFGWSATTGRLFRVWVPNLAVLGRHFDLDTLVSLEPEGARPSARPGRAAWQPVAPRVGVSSPIAGSADGAVVYIAGAFPGILLFDAQTLELVDRWASRASYFEVAVSSDANYVLALGVPTGDAGQVSQQGATLTVHEAGNGRIALILRRLESLLGTVPSFLVPQPGPSLGFGAP
jgi:hypothetical protein